jgi:hypothetical protein
MKIACPLRTLRSEIVGSTKGSRKKAGPAAESGHSIQFGATIFREFVTSARERERKRLSTLAPSIDGTYCSHGSLQK